MTETSVDLTERLWREWIAEGASMRSSHYFRHPLSTARGVRTQWRAMQGAPLTRRLRFAYLKAGSMGYGWRYAKAKGIADVR